MRAALEQARAAQRHGPGGWLQGGDVGVYLEARRMKVTVALAGFRRLEDLLLSLPWVHHERDERANAWFRLRVPEDAAGRGPRLPEALRRPPPLDDRPAYDASSLPRQLVAAALEEVGPDWESGGTISSRLAQRNVLRLVPNVGRKGAIEACLRALPGVEWRRDKKMTSFFRRRGGAGTPAAATAAAAGAAAAGPAAPAPDARPASVSGGSSDLGSVVRAILRDLAAAGRYADADGWIMASFVGSELKARGAAHLLGGASLRNALLGLPGVESEFDADVGVLYARLAAAKPKPAPAASPAATPPSRPAQLPPAAMAAAQRAVREVLFAAGGDFVYGPALQDAVAAALAEHAVDAADSGDGDGGAALQLQRLVDVLVEMPDVLTQRSGTLLRAAFRE